MRQVLVVDDDSQLREAVCAMLEGAGFKVAEAIGGNDAARLVRRRPPDAILCDLFMDAGDGLELICELRRHFPSVKIVAMSGGGFLSQTDMLPVARHLGAAAVLRKPFCRETLLEVLGTVLEPGAGTPT
jgi:CheY-like chemotaxis protein